VAQVFRPFGRQVELLLSLMLPMTQVRDDGAAAGCFFQCQESPLAAISRGLMLHARFK
jgi:hypothetical protein